MTRAQFPGHMAAALRSIRENARLVDVVIEVVDARAPLTTRDPDLAAITQKPRVVAMVKADLAEPAVTEAWRRRLGSEGTPAFAIDARGGAGVRDLLRGCRQAVGQSSRRLMLGGRERALRVMVVGVPNVGKSSLINRMTSGSSARTGAVPGVTRGMQWIRTAEGIEVLDLPGILKGAGRAEESEVKMALLGIIPETSYDPFEIALRSAEFLRSHRPSFMERLGLATGQDSAEFLEDLGRRKGCVVRGGEVDLTRTSLWFISQIRSGRVGRLSLEDP